MKTKNSSLITCNKLKYLTVFALAVISLSISVNAGQPKKSFVIIDSIHYHDKGNLSKYGLKPYTIFYGVHIWPKKKAMNLPPSDKHIDKLVKNITRAKSPVIYDIEHWPLDIRKGVKSVADDDIANANAKEVTASINKMIHVMKYSRKINPSVKYGYYACIPLRDYWSPVHNKPGQMETWKKANDFLKPLVDSVDVLCPSLYAFFPDREAWVKYAKANIAEAKRLANDKPVYAYLWPKYHISNKKDGKKFIEGDFWKLQLETIYNSGVDGIIIWDSPRVVNNPKDKVWDPKREWWQETVKFMKRLKK